MNKIWNYESGKDDPLSKLIKKDGDIVFTKDAMAQYLISKIEFKEGDRVMNPSYGKGAFYHNLPNNVNSFYCEINEGKDYLAQDTQVDITLDNPPFVPRKLFWSFMEKAMETTKREIYWLINTSALNVFTPNRLNQMECEGWFINGFELVADKRWYGRYVWCKIERENKNFIKWCNISF